MVEAKHTPGPWVVKPDDYSKVIHIQAPGPLGICHISGTAVARADSKANARLIAAAPDGLVLANAVLEMLVSKADVGGLLSLTERRVMEMTEAFIAKATGAA